VGYGPFSLCVIHKEGLCPSSGDINRLMMTWDYIIVSARVCIYSLFKFVCKTRVVSGKVLAPLPIYRGCLY
jgi:hypothetical protein